MIINVVIALVIVAALAIAGIFAWRMLQSDTNSSGGGGLFGNKADKRLGVVESTTLDPRRKLVLIRRDNVEHLIITGGPIDVVVETEIERVAGYAPRAPQLEPDPDRVVFGRSSTAQAGE